MVRDSSMDAFQKRWQAVKEVEALELRNASIELRWQQLNAIYSLALGLGILPDSERDEESVRQRWNQLKKHS